jgi:hypothetical protein
MISVKSMNDLKQFPESLSEWLKQENQYLDDENWEPEAGYLIVLDPSDNLKQLKTSIMALNDLNQIDCWDWVVFNHKLGFYCACVIFGDGFGMVVAIPESSVSFNEELYKNLQVSLNG